VARERGRVGERQALTPENADRVIVAGDRVARGERGAGEKAGFFGVFGMLRARAELGNGGTEGGGGTVIRGRGLAARGALGR